MTAVTATPDGAPSAELPSELVDLFTRLEGRPLRFYVETMVRSLKGRAQCQLSDQLETTAIKDGMTMKRGRGKEEEGNDEDGEEG